MNGQIGFLKVSVSFSFSLSFSHNHRLSSFLHTSHTFISFLCLAMYAFVSPVNSFVILHSLRRSLRHRITSALASFFSVFYYITDSLPASFVRVALCVSLHVCAYLPFVLLLYICILCVRLLFPSRVRRVSFGQSYIVYNAFLVVHVPRP